MIAYGSMNDTFSKIVDKRASGKSMKELNSLTRDIKKFNG